MRILLILLALVAVYGPFVARAGLVYEDTNGGESAIVRPWDGFGPSCLTAPRCLTYLSYRLDAFASGSSARFHLTSVWLHAVVTVGLFALTGSAFAAATFALHPLTTEAVAYIAARTELVAGLGVLLVLATVSTRAWFPGLLAGVWIAWQGSALTAVGLLLAWPVAASRAGWDGRAARVTAAGIFLLALGAGLWLGPLASPAELTTRGSAWLFLGQQAANVARMLAQLLVPIGQSIELPAASVTQMIASAAILVGGSWLAWLARHDWPRLTAAWAFLVAMLLPRMLLPRFEGLHERHLYAALLGAAWCLASPKGTV